jgi:multicomponent Na+:H+ antiporter subunit E
MSRILYPLGLFGFSGLVWLVLNETLSLAHFALGGLLGLGAIYMSEQYLTGINYRNVYRIPLGLLMGYLVFLVIEIFKSGWATIKLIVTGRVNPGVVTIHTDLTDPFRRIILANSITLTPGTVTIDCTGQHLTVLWLNCVTEDMDEAGELIKGRLERRLMGGIRDVS